MALNPIPTGARTLPMSNQLTAGGGYTAPQHAYIPHPTTQAFGHGSRVASPLQRANNANAVSAPGVNRNLPSVAGQVYGIRGGVR